MGSFSFVARRIPQDISLTNPLAAFRVAEAGRFLTARFRESGLPAIDTPSDPVRLSRLQSEELSRIRDRLKNLKEVVTELRGDEAFNLRNSFSTRPNEIDVEAGPESPVSRFRIRAQSQARRNILVSDNQSAGSLSLSGNFSINGVEVSIEAGDSLTDIRDKINRGEDLNNNGALDPAEDRNHNGAIDILSISGNEFGGSFFEIEDRNGNGSLDPSEDANDNGVLDGGPPETGVVASILNGRLVLTQQDGGVRNIDLQDDDGVLLSLGFFALNSKGQPVLKDVQLDFSTLQARDLNQLPSPASIEVDDRNLKSPTNRFEDVFPDTDLVLRQNTDREVLARVFLDAEAARAQIENLFGAFNESIIALNEALGGSGIFAQDLELQTVRQDLTGNILSQVEENRKNTDNRETIKPNEADNGSLGIRAVNTGKTPVQEIAVTSITGQLREGLQVPFLRAGNDLFQRLSSIGIRTREDDTFEIDRADLEEALLRKPEEVLSLLEDPETGLLPQLETQLDSLLKKDLGRLELKQGLLRELAGLEQVDSEQFRIEQENRALGRGFSNLIAVI